jgi:predicted nucleic acid-binding protein
MIVVADTSVILNLCRVQHEHLLQQLFKRVLIPAQVAGEFARLSKVQPRFSGLALPDWIEILPVLQPFPPEVVQAHLDIGESAAIALCLNQKADALLIDESLGREVAARLGVRTIGILGVLIEARRRQFIPDVKTMLQRLETEAGFWIAPSLRNRVLALAGEKI